MTNATRRPQSAARLDPHDLTLTLADTWMNHAELCALLGETRSTVDKWRRRGLVTGYRKPNGRVMFKRADVARFISALEVAA